MLGQNAGFAGSWDASRLDTRLRVSTCGVSLVHRRTADCIVAEHIVQLSLRKVLHMSMRSLRHCVKPTIYADDLSDVDAIGAYLINKVAAAMAGLRDA